VSLWTMRWGKSRTEKHLIENLIEK
jgi:hypothetical protein